MEDKLRKWIDKERISLSEQRKVASSKSEIDYIDGRMDELSLLIKEVLNN